MEPRSPLAGDAPLPISRSGINLPRIALHSGLFPIGKFPSTKRLTSCYFPDREIKMPTKVRSPADIGALVRSTRKEQNLRQDELAGVSGVGLRFIVDLEAGKPTAQIGKVLQVLQTLGCSIDILAPGERRK